MARAYLLKESLRNIFKLRDINLAEEYLDKWISHAQRCRIPAFVELQRKIKRNRTYILNTLKIGLSNARIEATNNKIKLLIRIAYGFRNIDTLISFVMLFCSSLKILWPRNSAYRLKIRFSPLTPSIFNPHLCTKSRKFLKWCDEV